MLDWAHVDAVGRICREVKDPADQELLLEVYREMTGSQKQVADHPNSGVCHLQIDFWKNSRAR